MVIIIVIYRYDYYCE